MRSILAILAAALQLTAVAAYESVGVYAPKLSDTDPATWGGIYAGMPANEITVSKLQALYDMILERMDVPSSAFVAGNDKQQLLANIVSAADRAKLASGETFSLDSFAAIHRAVKKFLTTRPANPSFEDDGSGAKYPTSIFPVAANSWGISEEDQMPPIKDVIIGRAVNAIQGAINWENYTGEYTPSTTVVGSAIEDAARAVIGENYADYIWLDTEPWEEESAFNNSISDNFQFVPALRLWPAMTNTLDYKTFAIANHILKMYKYQTFLWNYSPLLFSTRLSSKTYRYKINLAELKGFIEANAFTSGASAPVSVTFRPSTVTEEESLLSEGTATEPSYRIEVYPGAAATVGCYAVVKATVEYVPTVWQVVRTYDKSINGGTCTITEYMMKVQPYGCKVDDIIVKASSSPFSEVVEVKHKTQAATAAGALYTAGRQLRAYAPHYLGDGTLYAVAGADVVRVWDGVPQESEKNAYAVSATFALGDATSAAESLGVKIADHVNVSDYDLDYSPGYLSAEITPISANQIMGKSTTYYKQVCVFKDAAGNVTKESERFVAVPGNLDGIGDGGGSGSTDPGGLKDVEIAEDGSLMPPSDDDAEIITDPSGGSSLSGYYVHPRLTWEGRGVSASVTATFSPVLLLGLNRFNFTSW